MNTNTMNLINVLITIGIVSLVGYGLYAFWARRNRLK